MKQNIDSKEILLYKLIIEKEKVNKVKIPKEDGWLFWWDI